MKPARKMKLINLIKQFYKIEQSFNLTKLILYNKIISIQKKKKNL